METGFSKSYISSFAVNALKLMLKPVRLIVEMAQSTSKSVVKGVCVATVTLNGKVYENVTLYGHHTVWWWWRGSIIHHFLKI